VSKQDKSHRYDKAGRYQSRRGLNQKPTFAIQSPINKECAQHGIVQQTFIQRAAHFV
jgi:hypothetical protein